MGVEGCDVCSSSYTGSSVEVVNNCGHTIDVYTDAGNYGSCTWDSTKVPPCMRSMADGARANIRLLASAGWGYAFHIAPSFSTRFEITGWRAGDGQLWDSWDVSYNAGYDIGMTLVTPTGSAVPLAVATNQEAPGAYQLGADGCQVQPCLSPTYNSGQGHYELYLCNRVGDVNTPGPCGCQACPGISCDPDVKNGSPCTTSGSGIYCQVGGDGCPVQCNGLPSTSGGAGCDASCPGTQDGPVTIPVPSPTPSPSPSPMPLPSPTPTQCSSLVKWAKHPTKCMDVSAGRNENGANIQMWDCYDDQPNMQFILPTAGTTGEIQWTKHPDKCLSVAGGKTYNGNNLHLWSCIPGYKDMQFTVPESGGGLIRWASNPTKCLDVGGGATKNGNNVQLWDCYSDQPNMQFQAATTSDCVTGQCATMPAGTTTFWDPSCAHGGLGCMADGVNAECRFCGFGAYSDVPCP